MDVLMSRSELLFPSVITRSDGGFQRITLRPSRTAVFQMRKRTATRRRRKQVKKLTVTCLANTISFAVPYRTFGTGTCEAPWAS